MPKDKTPSYDPRQGPLQPVAGDGMVVVENPPAAPMHMTPDEADISGIRMLDAADRSRKRPEAGATWSEREALDPVAAAEERVLLGLRTVEGVTLADLARLGRSMEAGSLASLVQDGFLQLCSGRVTTTAAGRPVLDGVLKALLA